MAPFFPACLIPSLNASVVNSLIFAGMTSVIARGATRDRNVVGDLACEQPREQALGDVRRHTRCGHRQGDLRQIPPDRPRRFLDELVIRGGLVLHDRESAVLRASQTRRGDLRAPDSRVEFIVVRSGVLLLRSHRLLVVGHLLLMTLRVRGLGDGLLMARRLIQVARAPL